MFESWPPRPPGAQPPWFQQQLFARRLVFLNGYLDVATATRLTAELVTLAAASAEPIDLYVSSPDGTLEAAMPLVDTIDVLGAPVHTVVLGEVAGPAVVVVAVGRTRLAAPNARLRLTEPRAAVAGTSADVARSSERLADLRARFRTRLVTATGQMAETIAADLRDGHALSANEARDYGLVDDVAQPRP
ncbi:MAG: ATP-dependent Clp protease proteolytic subunit [Chloroflexi bacterium]|nr:ATP-dependent Clp protease proteolytic subunit [Chloroflexota bacterium]